MTVGEGEQVRQLELELDWSGARSLEAKIANQFVVQLGPPAGGSPDGAYLIIGEVTPPLILANTDEGRKAQAESYQGKLPVRVHGRYYLTRARLEELRDVLNRLADQYDEASGGGQPS